MLKFDVLTFEKRSAKTKVECIGFSIVEFDATIKELESKGIDFKLEQDGWIRLAHFTDLDSNQLFLAERKD